MRLFLWSHCLTALIDFSKSILQQAKRLRRRRQPVVATFQRSDQVRIGPYRLFGVAKTYPKGRD